MELNKMVYTIITLSVVVISVAAIMMPVLNATTQTHETFDNTQYGYYQMKELEVGDSWTLTDGTWYYGETALTSSDNENVSVIATDDCVFRQSGIVRGTTFKNNALESAVVMTVDNSNVIRVNETEAYSVSYNSGYGATTEGDYILKTYTDTAYVNGDTNLWVTGVTQFASGSANVLVIHIEGTIDDGLTITVEPVQSGTLTNISTSDYTLNYEAVDGYEDLYKITSVEFDITALVSGNDETTTISATYSTFVIPKEVTAELSQHLGNGEIALLNAIPALVLVCLVMVAVGLSVSKRDD